MRMAVPKSARAFSYWPFCRTGGPVAKGAGKLRVEPDGRAGVGDLLVVIAFGPVGPAPVRKRIGVFGVAADGVVAGGNGRMVVRDGLVVVALGRVGPTPAGVGIVVIRLEPDGRGVIGDGPLVLFILQICAAAIAIRLGVHGLEPDGFAEVGDRLVQVVLCGEDAPRVQ